MLGQCHTPQPKTPTKKGKAQYGLQRVQTANAMSDPDKQMKVTTPMAKPSGQFNFDTPATTKETEPSENGAYQSRRQMSKSPNRFREAAQNRAKSNNARTVSAVSV